MPRSDRPELYRTRATRAAGSIIALLVVVGAIGGAVLGEPTLGVLGGLGIGVAIAILLWLSDRRYDRI